MSDQNCEILVARVEEIIRGSESFFLSWKLLRGKHNGNLRNNVLIASQIYIFNQRENPLFQMYLDVFNIYCLNCSFHNNFDWHNANNLNYEQSKTRFNQTILQTVSAVLNQLVDSQCGTIALSSYSPKGASTFLWHFCNSSFPDLVWFMN